MDLGALMGQMGPLRDAMAQADKEREAARLTGKAGGGAIEVVLTGALQVEKVTVAPAAVAASSDDVGMLEDLILAALNDALRQFNQRFGGSPEEQMQKTMAGSDLGSLLGPLMGGMGGPPQAT